MIQTRFDLQGKVAIITGASRGIGLQIAMAFSAAGAQVAISGRKQAGLETAAAKIRELGGEVLPCVAHVGDPEAIDGFLKSTIETFGGVDILVNNAATNPHFGPILTAEEGHWQKIIDINVLGCFRMTKAAVPSMRQRGGGKIINVASIAGLVPQMGMGIYSISKAAVIAMTQVLAAELAQDGIQVNSIAPGFIKTRFSQALWEDPNLEKAITSRIPQGRMASPEELTGIALYLASDFSSFTTGATFVVDGGQQLSGGNPLLASSNSTQTRSPGQAAGRSSN